MKFFAYLAVAASAQQERKVPPRTPPQRLDTLTRFAVEYCIHNLENTSTKNDGSQLRNAENIKEAFENRVEANLLAIYNKSNDHGLRVCSYFNPAVPNGGPRPEEEMNKRDLWAWTELRNLDSRSGRSRRSLDYDPEDPFDVFWNTPEDQRSVAPRLSDDRALALRQIRTGFQKWILRYISECSGQEAYGLHSRRLRKITDHVYNKMTSIDKYQEEIDFSGANWDKDNFFEGGSEPIENHPNFDSDDY